MSAPPDRSRRIRRSLLLLAAAPAAWLALLGPSCGPWDRTPGFALFGERAAGPVSDWQFVQAYPEIALETRTPWLLPHSVTVAWLLVDGALFIPARNAATKTWIRNVLRQPQVRMRIGDRIHHASLTRVTEPRDHERLFHAVIEKWPQLPERAASSPTMWFFRVESR